MQGFFAQTRAASAGIETSRPPPRTAGGGGETTSGLETARACASGMVRLSDGGPGTVDIPGRGRCEHRGVAGEGGVNAPWTPRSCVA